MKLVRNIVVTAMLVIVWPFLLVKVMLRYAPPMTAQARERKERQI